MMNAVPLPYYSIDFTTTWIFRFDSLFAYRRDFVVYISCQEYKLEDIITTGRFLSVTLKYYKLYL